MPKSIIFTTIVTVMIMYAGAILYRSDGIEVFILFMTLMIFGMFGMVSCFILYAIYERNKY